MLIELICAVFSASLVAAAALGLLATHAELFGRVTEEVRAMADLTFAADVAWRDLQTAAQDPRCVGVGAVLGSSVSRIVLRSDRDGDGAVDSQSSEEIELAAASGQRLTRRVGRQSMSMLSELSSAEFRAWPAGSSPELARLPRRVDFALEILRSWRGRPIGLSLRAVAALRAGCNG